MKVVQVDNFDREGPGHDDRLVAGALTKETADLLNEEHSGFGLVTFLRPTPNDAGKGKTVTLRTTVL